MRPPSVWATVGVFTSGIVDDGPVRGADVGSVRLALFVWASLLVGAGGVGVEPLGVGVVGGLCGTLLGPERSGACPLLWGCGVGCFLVVWFLDSGREHLCSNCFFVVRSYVLIWHDMAPRWLRFFLGGWGAFLLCWFVCVATSYEGHMVDALASRADEGRRSLR